MRSPAAKLALIMELLDPTEYIDEKTGKRVKPKPLISKKQARKLLKFK